MFFVAKIRLWCQCTSSIESKTISCISPTGCFFRTIAGSRACIGLFLWGRCFGRYSTFGHQVGDWEKVIVRFRKVNTNYQIYSIHLSTHNQEITYKDVGEFHWQRGMFKKGSRTLGISMAVLMHSLLCLGFTSVLTES